MSFTPHPIIPQTREQARQRDQRELGRPSRPANPAHELVRLREAIRRHRATLNDLADSEPALRDGSHTAADRALWAHLP